MKRIILHWAASGYKAGTLSKKHYHYIIEGDGNIVRGDNPVSANEVIYKGQKYAAHTYHTNTGSIGISMAAMRGAVEKPLSYGPSPFKEVQFESMCKLAAELAIKYNIKNTDKTILTHAEVQPNLGIKQKGKWDINVIPFKPTIKGHRDVGDYIRSRVEHYINVIYNDESSPIEKSTKTQGPVSIKQIQTFLRNKGYLKVSVDGVVGPITRNSLKNFQRNNNLPITGKITNETIKALGL